MSELGGDFAAKLMALSYRHPAWPGLCHGEPRRENAFFTDKGVVLLDFQNVMPAGPAPDLAFVLVFELSDELREKAEAPLLRSYLEASGLSHDMAEMWYQYKLGILYVLFTLATSFALKPITDRNMTMMQAYLRRTILACNAHKIDAFMNKATSLMGLKE
jgi:thiamine kinase-like enzyme